MKTSHLLRFCYGLALLSVAGCAPQALFFHESTKVGFSADYTTSNTEPLSTHFGFKRTIVAVVPAKDRTSTSGNDSDAENNGEALSTISKFYVKVDSGTLVIQNNFATGMAARKILKGDESAVVATAGLMHSTPVLTDSTGAVVDSAGTPVRNPSGAVTVSDVAAARVAAIRSKMIGGGKSGVNSSRASQVTGPVTMETFTKDGKTWVRLKRPDGTTEKEMSLDDYKKLKAPSGGKPAPANSGTGQPALPVQ